jgi:heptosyltransferase I
MAGPTAILVLRMGAMGDIVHTLPAVASLKHSIPNSRVAWLVDSKWAPLLEANPFVDTVVEFDRGSLTALAASLRRLRASRYDLAIDFQGLVKSGLAAALARPERIFGFDRSQVRERGAALFYSRQVRATAAHVVDRNLELAAAAGATSVLTAFPLPSGEPEHPLPPGPYVFAAPMAGWLSKQWPLEYYKRLAKRLKQELNFTLVLNGPPAACSLLASVPDAWAHVSGIKGLIDAVRRATAVVGVDSGPLHLGAALNKPGVAIFGPTDPARNGPYGAGFTVLRSPSAATSYKRRQEIDPSMRAISADQVFESLKARVLCPA